MNPPSKAELDERFAFHPATATTGPLHEQVRGVCRTMADWITQLTPPSREQSLALTAMQEAMMWANAAIAIHGPPESLQPPRNVGLQADFESRRRVVDNPQA